MHAIILTLVCGCRDKSDPASLRRLVVRIGTPGGSNGHKIVSRCIQGLFREVGMSPNFVWDKGFEIPHAYLSNEQRICLEDADLDQKVKQIQAVQRGVNFTISSDSLVVV